MPKVNQCTAPKMIPFTTFDEYKEKYKRLFVMDRTESGVLTARWYDEETGGPAFWDYPLHRAIGQLCADVAQDAETEVLIIGGTGDQFLALGPTSLPEDAETQRWALYEHSYFDGCRMLEGLVNVVEQPTIGIINGFASHSEIATLCDITLMAEDAQIFDGHFAIAGGLFGDGIQIALRELMGVKRANYAMLLGKPISAQEALELGLVNEVLPREKLYDRARELGEIIAKKPRVGRRMLAQTMRMPWKEQFAKELRTTFGQEMWCMMASRVTHDEAFAMMADQHKLWAEDPNAISGVCMTDDDHGTGFPKE